VPWAAIVVTIDGDTIDPSPNNNAVYNNFVYGGEINVQQLQTSTSTIPIQNTFVYFNTVVNPGGYGYMMGGTQKGLIIKDNIFVGAGGNPWYSNVALATNNYWLTSPVFSNGRPSNLSNPTTDVIGNAEASMAKTGSLSPGQVTAAWFYLLSNSPARHAGAYLPAVSTDAVGTPRPQSPDLGAVQYGSGP
jgi:hypothetical protein